MLSDDLAASALSALGFDVQVIPVSGDGGKKRPDFIISSRGETAVVEAKLKLDDAAEASRREEILSNGEVYVSEHVLGRDETLSAIVGRSNRQLRASPLDADYKILMFLAHCINAKVVADQMVDTLYGRTTVIEMAKGAAAKPCYFYRNSDFYRRPELDGAIVGYVAQGRAKLRFCINPYSQKFAELRASDLLLPFGGAVIDPIEEEAKGLAYIPDPDIERKENAFSKLFPLYDPVLRHLAAKYQKGHLTRTDFNSPEITIRSTKHGNDGG
ncbi:hypothetical protein [Rugamonas apoptosis]|uniref:Uncharacterized protein n=1 Tax=Rugamonas apoptosis TaxID=2758570 RepID=A0A7W2F7S8_9BURK|nr:hypothetical protein [Rugamonas apoptosis]MBA5686693.1 hypothetical protein [Rugamonas apoptosis]